MKRLLAVILLTVGACSNLTGPQGKDPTVLVLNQQSNSPTTLTWWDQSGQVQQTALSAFSTTCVKFLSTKVTDSVRFQIIVGDTTGAHGSWSQQSSPWFDPKTGLTGASPGTYPYGAEYWRLTIVSATSMFMKTDSVAPC